MPLAFRYGSPSGDNYQKKARKPSYWKRYWKLDAISFLRFNKKITC